MKANSKVKPYKGIEVGKGFTKYSVSQSKKDAEGNWKVVGWLNIMVKGGAPIPEKNPDRKELVIQSIQGVDLDTYKDKLNVTVWAEGYVAEDGTPSGFSQVDDECPF